MTMHLIRGMSSLNTRKHKAKSRATSEYEAEFHEHNKQARRDGMPQLQFKTVNDYIANREGTGVKVSKSKVFKPLKSKNLPARFVRETPVYPSKASSVGITGKAEVKQYSGDYMIGIATMHKSNLVPVGRDTNPTDYSTMRRN